jgi:endonuclease VIII
VLVSTEDVVAIGFNIPVAELLTRRDLARHKELRALGPDLLDSAFDRAEAMRRLLGQGRETIADALLNQRVMAGIGNVFKSEILFLVGIHPFTQVSAIPDEALARVVDVARDQLRANVLSRSQTLNVSTGRTTTRSLDPNRKLWVYGRGGERCLKCGTSVESRKTGLDARLTFWCPACQKNDRGLAD